MKHGGNGNGSLIAPYGLLTAFGITRRLIALTIREAEGARLSTTQRVAAAFQQQAAGARPSTNSKD